jgi:YggT family protein
LIGGGAKGNRTPDLVIANDALYQLSYRPDLALVLGGRPRGVKPLGCTCRLNHLDTTQTGTFSMIAVIWLINNIFNLVWWLILASVVLSWLFAFNIVNVNNPTVRQISYGLSRLTEPLLAPIRRILPQMGGLDLSPIILLILLEFLRQLLIGQLIKFAV